ncbi:MAG: helix-turn-helix domain-containing protein [Firmicutes bacterium]|nr:helix-turn-helix domain-containing protein [Bacillota bacterium]
MVSNQGARSKGNQSVAAEILGVSRVTILNRMKRFDIKYNRYLESSAEDLKNGSVKEGI